MADEELRRVVREYAIDIEAAANRTLYKVDGEPTVIDDMDEWKQNEWERKKEEFLEDEIGTVDDIDEPEQMSVTDYIYDNSLGDIRFEVNKNMECLGGRVLLAYGGPNVWLHDDEICGYWGGNTETWSLCMDAQNALMEFFQEEWEMICNTH